MPFSSAGMRSSASAPDGDRMATFQENLYDVLGVPRDAPMHDIGRAWNRYRAAQRSEATPPDARRDALMRHAYETLSDPHRRAAYDAALRRQSPVLQATRRSPAKVGAIAVAAAAMLAGVAWYVLGEPGRPPTAARPTLKTPEEIRDSLVRGVGRVKLVDLSGHETLLGIAVTIEPGVMATACAGLSPSAEPLVVSPRQTFPARVAGYDPSGLCRLEVSGGAQFPLPITGVPPHPGARVYTTEVAANGEPRVLQATVTRLGGGEIRAMQASIAVGSADGRPLLDEDGRLAAIGVRDESGGGRYVPLPRSWIARETAPVVAPPVVHETPPTAEGKARKPPIDISPERAQRLNDAFRPPPKIPDDL